MLIIPALNLKPDRSRHAVASVADILVEWERLGFGQARLNLPRTDRTPDTRIIEDILRDVHSPVQVAGPFESSDDIDAALSAGASFVALGDRAIDDPDWLASAASRFPGQLLVAIPARERRARTRGGVRTLPLNLRDLAGDIGTMPLAGIVVEFAADEPIGIPELALLEDVVEEVDFGVQVAGGAPDLGTLRDLEFRGVFATVMNAARLSAEFDEQALARSFAD